MYCTFITGKYIHTILDKQSYKKEEGREEGKKKKMGKRRQDSSPGLEKSIVRLQWLSCFDYPAEATGPDHTLEGDVSIKERVFPVLVVLGREA